MSKPSWLRLSRQQQDEFGQLVPSETWRRVSRDELPSVFSTTLRSKLDSAIMVSTISPQGVAYLAFSADRVDLKTESIDIEPFAIAMPFGEPPTTGLFLHHGTWPDRTVAAPDGLLEAIDQSGIGNYFLSHPPEGKVSGRLDELSRGHRGAFDALVGRLIHPIRRLDGSAG